MKNETPASIASIDWLKARPRKLSVRIDGHATSISLEQAYIDILLQEAEKRELSFAGIVTLIDEARPAEINLSAALRLFALKLVQNSDIWKTVLRPQFFIKKFPISFAIICIGTPAAGWILLKPAFQTIQAGLR